MGPGAASGSSSPHPVITACQASFTGSRSGGEFWSVQLRVNSGGREDQRVLRQFRSAFASSSWTPVDRRDVGDVFGDVGRDLRLVDEVHPASAAPVLGAPTGITMLSDHSVQPSVGIRHSAFSFSISEASPDQPIAATMLPAVRSSV